MGSFLFKPRDAHMVPSIQPRFFCCIHPCGISVKKMDSWAKLKGMRSRKSGLESKLPEACSSSGVHSLCSRSVPSSTERCPPHTTLLPSPSPGQGKKNPHQEIVSVVQNEADVSAPWMLNDTLVTEQDLPFSKACNL